MQLPFNKCASREPFERLQKGSHIWEEWLIFQPPNLLKFLGTNLEESFPSFFGPTKSKFWTTSKSSCICTKPSSSSKATWLWDLLVTKCCFWKSSNTSKRRLSWYFPANYSRVPAKRTGSQLEDGWNHSCIRNNLDYFLNRLNLNSKKESVPNLMFPTSKNL